MFTNKYRDWQLVAVLLDMGHHGWRFCPHYHARQTCNYFFPSYGLISEITNKSEEEIQITESVIVSSLQDMLVNKYHQLADKSYQVAVNQSLAGQDKEIKDNDEVALLPPFAGG